MKKDFMPTSEGKVAEWMGNYANKIPSIGAACGMTEEEIKFQVALALSLTDEMQNATKAQADSKKATAVKDDQKSTSISGIRANIAHLKANPNWKDSMSKDLQAEGADRTPDPATYKARLSGSVNSGAVQLRIFKAGVQAVNVYSRIGNTGEFVFLKRVSLSTYTDKRLLAAAGVAEIRQYYVMGVMSDKEIGLPSDILTINFGG